MAQSRIATLLLKLAADTTGLSGPLKQMSRDISDAARKSQAAFGGFATLGKTLSDTGLRLSAGLTAPLIGAGAAALQAAAKIESAGTAFRTMTGSAEKAKKLLGDIRQFALSTPFEFPDLIRSGQKLLAFGFDAAKVVPIMRSVGNAVSSVGGGSVELDRVTLALGQIQAKGKVASQELNQLSELGIPVREILAKSFGVTQAQLVALTEKGAIPAKEAIQALLAGFDSRFGGAMADQAKTLAGIFSNLKDQVTDSLASIGEALAPTAKRIAAEFVAPALDQLKRLAAGFAELPPAAQNAALGVAGIAAVAGPTLFVLGQLAISLTSIISLAKQLQAINWVAAFPVAGKVSAVLAAVLGLGYALKELNDRYNIFGTAPVRASGALGEFVKRAEVADRITANSTNGIARQGLAYENLLAHVRTINGAQGAANRTNAEAATGAKTTGDAIADLSKRLQEMTAHTEKAKAVPEWARTTAALAADVFARFKDLPAVLRDAVREEGFNRQAAEVKAWADALIDGAQKQRKLADDLPIARNAVVELTAAFQGSEVALSLVNDKLRSNGAAWNAALLGVRRFKTELEDFGITSAKKVAEDIIDLENILADLSRSVNLDARDSETLATLREIADVERKIAELRGETTKTTVAGAARQRDALIEVSTITTNLSQSLSRLIFEGGKFGETMVKVGKQIGESITSNLIQRLITSSGLIDKIGKGLGGVLKKLPGLGGLGNIFGGGASAAGSVLGSGGSAGAAASQALSAGLSSTISAVTGAVSAISGVIGNFQQATANKRLGQLEVTSRGQLNQAISQQETFNLWLPVLGSIHERLRQVITNGIGVYSQPASVVRVALDQVLNGVDLGGTAQLALIAERLNPLQGMSDRLFEFAAVGIGVYNAPGSALAIAGAPGFTGNGGANITLNVGEGVIVGGPGAGMTLDWLTDQIFERLQRRGVKF